MLQATELLSIPSSLSWGCPSSFFVVSCWTLHPSVRIFRNFKLEVESASNVWQSSEVVVVLSLTVRQSAAAHRNLNSSTVLASLPAFNNGGNSSVVSRDPGFLPLQLDAWGVDRTAVWQQAGTSSLEASRRSAEGFDACKDLLTSLLHGILHCFALLHCRCL